MELKRPAVSGTMESSDIMISIYPVSLEEGIQINLTSAVDMYYHEDIVRVIREALEEQKVGAARIEAADKGALDCTIRARVKTAVSRAAAEEGGAK